MNKDIKALAKAPHGRVIIFKKGISKQLQDNLCYLWQIPWKPNVARTVEKASSRPSDGGIIKTPASGTAGVRSRSQKNK